MIRARNEARQAQLHPIYIRSTTARQILIPLLVPQFVRPDCSQFIDAPTQTFPILKQAKAKYEKLQFC
jgi:hypothetical protein